MIRAGRPLENGTQTARLHVRVLNSQGPLRSSGTGKPCRYHSLRWSDGHHDATSHHTKSCLWDGKGQTDQEESHQDGASQKSVLSRQAGLANAGTQCRWFQTSAANELFWASGAAVTCAETNIWFQTKAETMLGTPPCSVQGWAQGDVAADGFQEIGDEGGRKRKKNAPTFVRTEGLDIPCIKQDRGWWTDEVRDAI